MQNIENVQVSCPKCKEFNNFKLQTSVNITDNKKVRDDILNGKFFIKKCQNCETEMTIEYPFIYHDSVNRFMIYYLPEIRDKDINEINEKIKTSDSINEEIKFTYSMRIVGDLESLKEKIYIFENGKNDITLELYKTLVISSLRDSHPEFIPYDILYTNDNKLIAYGEKTETLMLSIMEDLYNKLQDDIGEVISDSIGKGFIQVDAHWIKDKFYN